MSHFKDVIGFQWDSGNSDKNYKKHGITDGECEEVFWDKDSVIREDEQHSTREKRYIIIGKESDGKLLFVVFTIRRNLVRVISARILNKKEKKLYK